MTTMNALTLAAAIQCFLSSAALCLIAGRKAKKAYLLAFLVMLIGVTNLADFLSDGEQVGEIYDFSVHPLIGILSGPIAYLYTRSLTRKGIAGTKMPFLFWATAVLPVFLYIAVSLPIFRKSFFIAEAASLISLSGFLAASLFEYIRFAKEPESSSFKFLGWLRFFLSFMALLAITAAVLFFQRRYFDVIWPVASFLAFSINFMAMTKPESLYDSTASQKAVKYRKSALSADKILRYRENLDSLFTENKVYLDRKLDLGKLASLLSISPHRVSQVINRSYGIGFHEFLSKQRVAAAKEILVTPSSGNRKILDICHSSGFSTLSAFNAAFKKETGFSPSEFRKRHENF